MQDFSDRLLEAVDTGGRTVQYGPVEGSLPVAPQNLYYLPIVQKGP
jgi:hypothetical protein